MTFTSDLNYTTYVSQIANIAAISSANANFQTMLPGAIDYAEQRIYREADFLATYVTDTSTNVQANVKVFPYPTSLGTFLVIDQINIYTPAGATSSNAVRVPLQVASKHFIDIVYPSNATSIGTPTYFAPATATACLLGPVPDQSYNVEVTGTQRPQSLSSGNSSTFLTQTLPDLFIAASMIFVTGYMQNFGAQADNPQMAVSWTSQYDKLFASAVTEEFRKKYQSQAWQNQLPNPVATPSRT
jgi:hypothetical protein